MNQWLHNQPGAITLPLQLDSGANRSVTNNQALLQQYQPIQHYTMSGIAHGEPAIFCIGKGLLPWHSQNSEVLPLPCFYSPNACKTNISPTDIVLSHPQLYSAWCQYADCDTAEGCIQFVHQDGADHTFFVLTMHNELWYYSGMIESKSTSLANITIE